MILDCSKTARRALRVASGTISATLAAALIGAASPNAALAAPCITPDPCPAAGPCTIDSATPGIPSTLPSGCELDASDNDLTIDSAIQLGTTTGGSFTIKAKSLLLGGTLRALRGDIDILVKDSLLTNGLIDISSATNSPIDPGSLLVGPLSAGDHPSVTISGVIDAHGAGGAAGVGDGGTVEILDASTIVVNAAINADGRTSLPGKGGKVKLIASDSVTINAAVSVKNSNLSPTIDEAMEKAIIDIVSVNNVTVASSGTLSATGSGNSGNGGTINIRVLDIRGTITVGGTVDVTATAALADSDGQITVGPACTINVGGTLDAQDDDNVNGKVTLKYRGSVSITGSVKADAAPGGTVFECRCRNTAPGGTCAVTPECFLPSMAGIVGPTSVVPVFMRACDAEAVLLIDGSGSMNWAADGDFPVPAGEQPRVFYAKAAAHQFVDTLNLMNDEAKVGIARFPEAPFGGCNGERLMNLKVLKDGKAEADGHITAFGADGSTPLLAGMDKAIDTFSTDPASSRAMILLSDGYHNCPGPVTDPTDAQLTTRISNANAKHVDVYSIAFGAAGDPDARFLDEVATNTGGRFKDVTPAAGFNPVDVPVALSAEFTKVFTDTFGFDTSSDPLGSISGGSVDTQKTSINPHDRTVTVILGWQTNARQRLRLTVRSSDGQVVPVDDAGVRSVSRSTYTILTMREDFLRQPGKVSSTPWTLEIGAEQVPASEEERYQYSVIVDSSLNLHTGLTPAAATTASTLTLTAKLSESDRPLTDADVSVAVTRPDDGLGNWLFENEISSDTLATAPGMKAQDAVSPISNRVGILAGRGVDFPEHTAPSDIKLYDDATHGDLQAGDGVYTNQFTDTAQEGTYVFRFRATGKTPAGDVFVREDAIHRHVSLALTTGASVIATAPAAGANRFQVTVDPRDARGNHLGPDRGGLLRLTPSHGVFLGALQDLGDGRYSRVLELPAGIDVKDVVVDVGVKGQEPAPAQPPCEPEREGCCFWRWLKGLFGAD